MTPEQVKAIPEAVAQLIELVADDETTPMTITQIKVDEYQTIGSEKWWSVAAKLDDNTWYKYAIYISPNGVTDADGF